MLGMLMVKSTKSVNKYDTFSVKSANTNAEVNILNLTYIDDFTA